MDNKEPNIVSLVNQWPSAHSFIWINFPLIRKRWDALFIPEKILRVHSSLHFYQPVKIVHEVLHPIYLTFLVAIFTIVANTNVNISIVEIWTSRGLGHIRGHVAIKLSHGVHILLVCFSPFFLPSHWVLDLEYVPRSMWEVLGYVPINKWDVFYFADY